MHRIFFDTNEGSFENGYWLHLPQSKADLDDVADDLVDGLQVVIEMPDELEMIARLKYDAEHNFWVAYPISGTITYLDGPS